jgi:hypothetical protein
VSAETGYQPEASSVRSVHEAVPTWIVPMRSKLDPRQRVRRPEAADPDRPSQLARRSRFCLQLTHVVAEGKTSSRSTGIGFEHPSQLP